MNRRNFVHASVLAATGAVIIAPLSLAAAGKVGNLDPVEFTRINKEAGAKLASIKPGAEPLSGADKKLLLEIAAGGTMQLEMSKAAVAKATSEDVRAVAQAEVEEQTGLAAKLKEVAAAKSVTLPEGPDEKTKKMVAKLQAMSGTDFDRAYLKQSGVEGHEKLNATMDKVQSKAADATLKTIAATALPLIKTHLQVSQDEIKDLG